MNNVAIIPARGGSKRIPRKNIKDFCGKPIISYAIDSAKKSELFADIIVSTDDEEIANIGNKYGASIPFIRSKDLADDYSSTSDVIADAIKRIGVNKYDCVCCIYPCTPLISSKHLVDAFKLLDYGDIDCVYPIVKYSYPPQRGLVVKNGLVKMLYPENFNKRTQDIAQMYHDAGQFYFMKIGLALSSNCLTCNNCSFIELSEIETQDIDNESDWALAELKYKLKNA